MGLFYKNTQGARRASQVEARGPHTPGRRGPGACRAAWWGGCLVAPLLLVFWLRYSSVKIGPLELIPGIFLKVEFLHKNETPA